MLPKTLDVKMVFARYVKLYVKTAWKSCYICDAILPNCMGILLTGPKSLVKTSLFSALRPGPPVIGTLRMVPEGGRCLLSDQTPHLSDMMFTCDCLIDDTNCKKHVCFI